MQSTNTNHKYITYYEKRDEYIVAFKRDKQVFNVHVSTLEDAIDLRNRALQFYEEHNRVPTREDLSIARRRQRNRKKTRIDAVEECKICFRSLHFRYPRNLEEFEKNGKICGYCRREMEHSMSSDNATGQLNEKYIVVERGYAYGTKYRLTIVKFGQMFTKSFDRVEDAVKIRDEVIDFYNGFNRLPNLEEQKEIFDVKTRDRKISTPSIKSRVSASGLKNISLDEESGRCHVQIARNRVKFSTSCKNIEDAKRVREAVLAFYEEFDRLPSNKEYRKYMKERKSGNESKSSI